MSKHLIIPNFLKKIRTKNLSDCKILAEVINNEVRGSEVYLLGNSNRFNPSDYDYIWHTFEETPNYGHTKAKFIKFNSQGLLWYKFGCTKPIYPEGHQIRYRLLYPHVYESGKALELMQSYDFYSQSFSLTKEGKLTPAHHNHNITSEEHFITALRQSEAVLIDRGHLCHSLCQALFYNVLILINSEKDQSRSLGFDEWHYVRTPEEIAQKLKSQPIDQHLKQQQTKVAIWQKLKAIKINVNQLL